MKRLIPSILSAAALAGAMALSTSAAQAEDKIVRIGFQKYGKLILLKGKGTLEKRLEALGAKVTWTEFPAGRSCSKR